MMVRMMARMMVRMMVKMVRLVMQEQDHHRNIIVIIMVDGWVRVETWEASHLEARTWEASGDASTVLLHLKVTMMNKI